MLYIFKCLNKLLQLQLQLHIHTHTNTNTHKHIRVHIPTPRTPSEIFVPTTTTLKSDSTTVCLTSTSWMEWTHFEPVNVCMENRCHAYDYSRTRKTVELADCLGTEAEGNSTETVTFSTLVYIIYPRIVH